MSDEVEDDEYLSIRELFSERLLRDLILFLSLVVFIISQEWENILLLLFPLISFSYSIFFRLLDENKWRTKFHNSPIVYNPLGSERKHANRFIFSALLLSIILFWFGAESIYHPQLIDNYSLFFLILFFFIYTFTYFWIFIDLWKYCRIKIEVKKEIGPEIKNIEHYSQLFQVLRVNVFKRIIYISLFSFLALNVLNLLLILFLYNGIMPGFNIPLPGTGLEGSEPLRLHFFVYILLIIPPIISFLLLLMAYKDINKIEIDKLEEVINRIPEKLRLILLEQIKILNNKLIQDLDIE
ncbi:MAG: hypothetical protein R6W84_17535 [Promethearchaeia archaeon]